MEIARPPMTAIGEGLQHLRAGAEGEGQRQHSGYGGEGGHQDGAQTAAAGENHGASRLHADVEELLIGVEQQDSILCDDADDHDESHEGGDVEGDSGH